MKTNIYVLLLTLLVIPHSIWAATTTPPAGEPKLNYAAAITNLYSLKEVNFGIARAAGVSDIVIEGLKAICKSMRLDDDQLALPECQQCLIILDCMTQAICTASEAISDESHKPYKALGYLFSNKPEERAFIKACLDMPPAKAAAFLERMKLDELELPYIRALILRINSFFQRGQELVPGFVAQIMNDIYNHKAGTHPDIIAWNIDSKITWTTPPKKAIKLATIHEEDEI